MPVDVVVQYADGSSKLVTLGSQAAAPRRPSFSGISSTGFLPPKG